MMDMDKEIHAFILLITLHAMHDSRKGHMTCFNVDAHLFLSFPGRRVHHSFAAIQMAGWDTILSICVARVEATQQQNLIFTKKQQMYGDGKLCTHGIIILLCSNVRLMCFDPPRRHDEL